MPASKDWRGEREYLGSGGEKRRSPTGGSAKGIPGSEGWESSCQNERAITSEKLEIRGLKCFSYECGISEFHAGLAGSLGIASSKKGSQEKRAEKECPHDAKSSMKSRKGGPLPLQWPRRYTICIK